MASVRAESRSTVTSTGIRDVWKSQPSLTCNDFDAGALRSGGNFLDRRHRRMCGHGGCYGGCIMHAASRQTDFRILIGDLRRNDANRGLEPPNRGLKM
jgi:hypothetical protein